MFLDFLQCCFVLFIKIGRRKGKTALYCVSLSAVLFIIFMNRIYNGLFRFLTVIICVFGVLSLSGCKQGISASDFVNIDGVSYISYNKFSKAFSFSVTKDNDYVHLKQDDIEVDLKIGTRFIFQYGNLVDSAKHPFLLKNGVVFIPASFVDGYLGLNEVYSEAKSVSLYTVCKFLPSQVLYAVNNEKEKNNSKILEQISLPVYKGYSGWYLDLGRVISFEQFPDSFSKEHEKIINENGFSKQSINYSEYLVIKNSSFINQFDMEVIKSDPALENQDISLWTVDDYNKWLSARQEQELFNFVYSSPDDLRRLHDLGLSMKDAVNIYNVSNKKVAEIPVDDVYEILDGVYKASIDKVTESSGSEKL